MDVSRATVERLVLLDDLQELVGFGDAAIVIAEFACKVLGEEILIRLADDFFLRKTHRLAEALVRETETSGEILANDVHGDRLDQRFEHRPGLAHLPFGLSRPFDVPLPCASPFRGRSPASARARPRAVEVTPPPSCVPRSVTRARGGARSRSEVRNSTCCSASMVPCRNLPTTRASNNRPVITAATVTSRLVCKFAAGHLHGDVHRHRNLEDSADVTHFPVVPRSLRVTVVAGDAACPHAVRDGESKQTPPIDLLEAVEVLARSLSQGFPGLEGEIVPQSAVLAPGEGVGAVEPRSRTGPSLRDLFAEEQAQGRGKRNRLVLRRVVVGDFDAVGHHFLDHLGGVETSQLTHRLGVAKRLFESRCLDELGLRLIFEDEKPGAAHDRQDGERNQRAPMEQPGLRGRVTELPHHRCL